MKRLAYLPLLGLLLAPNAFADDEDKAIQKIQGTWNVVRYVNDGKEETPSADQPETLIIKGNHYELKRSDGEYRGDLKLDSSAKPAKIDATLFDTKDKKLGEATGIYKMEGEKLIICWNEIADERPKEFASVSGSKVRLITLEKK